LTNTNAKMKITNTKDK